MGGNLTVEFENVDKTGFENFNSMHVEEEIAETDGYKQYSCNGLWNGTGDFKLSFTGDIFLYMLILSTDRVESLAYKYKTLFEQSETLVKIAAQNFDKDGNVLSESDIITTAKYNELISQRFNEDGSLKNQAGLVTATDYDAWLKQYNADTKELNEKFGNYVSIEAFAGMFASAVDENKNIVKQADISAFVTKDEKGYLESGVHISADNIKLEGLVTANENFKILEDGSIEAKNAKINGKVEAYEGKIGYFSIDNQGLYYGDPTKWTDSSYKQNLAAIRPGLIKLQSQIGVFKPGDVANIKVAIGNGADPQMTESTSWCNCAGYFYRQMNPDPGDDYLPAVKIVSDNVVNRNVALYTKGAIVCDGGLIEIGRIVNTTSAGTAYIITLDHGTTLTAFNNSSGNTWISLPTLAEIRLQLSIGSEQTFCVPVKIINSSKSLHNVYVKMDDDGDLLNRDGGHWRDDNKNTDQLCLGKGDSVSIALTYVSGSYYGQVLDINR